jgi:hypothetical protein
MRIALLSVAGGVHPCADIDVIVNRVWAGTRRGTQAHVVIAAMDTKSGVVTHGRVAAAIGVIEKGGGPIGCIGGAGGVEH